MSYFYDDANKFIKDTFWAESHNKENKINIPEIISNKLIEDNKNKDPEYYDHREGVVHVSSLSKCLRGVVHEMLGAKKDTAPDARKLGVFKAGNLFEEYIVDALGDRMLDRQTEYVFKYKNIILTGRDDGTILENGQYSVLEVKSVRSDSFWYREKEGILVAYQNQMQLQTYLWLRRECPLMLIIEKDGKSEVIYTNLSVEEYSAYQKLAPGTRIKMVSMFDNSSVHGVFSYVSKDDCTVIGAPVKYNPRIIQEVVLPALDVICEAYEKKDPSLAPVPSLVVYDDTKGQHQKNWLATYCEFHSQCAGAGWILEAQNAITQKNKEAASAMQNFVQMNKKEKPVITTEPLPKVDG